MKKFLLVWCALLVVAAGFGCAKKGGASKADTAFETLAKAYIETVLQMNPESATLLGDHRYDDKLTDRSAAAIAAQVAVNKEYLGKLAEIDVTKLSDVNAVDYDIMKINLESGVFQAEELREHEWNPLYYNMGGAIYSLVAREFAPIDKRLASVQARVEGIPAVLALAKAQLQNPPKVFTETAILQNQGNVSLLKEELAPFIQQAPAMEAQLKPRHRRGRRGPRGVRHVARERSASAFERRLSFGRREVAEETALLAGFGPFQRRNLCPRERRFEGDPAGDVRDRAPALQEVLSRRSPTRPSWAT